MIAEYLYQNGQIEAADAFCIVRVAHWSFELKALNGSVGSQASSLQILSTMLCGVAQKSKKLGTTRFGSGNSVSDDFLSDGDAHNWSKDGLVRVGRNYKGSILMWSLSWFSSSTWIFWKSVRTWWMLSNSPMPNCQCTTSPIDAVKHHNISSTLSNFVKCRNRETYELRSVQKKITRIPVQIIFSAGKMEWGWRIHGTCMLQHWACSVSPIFADLV